MQHLIDAVRQSVADKNWYAALTGALTLPDIAGKLDGRGVYSKARFVSWFNDYLTPFYTRLLPDEVGESLHVFLNGEDCYALRCAYLHRGEFDVNNPQSGNILDMAFPNRDMLYSKLAP